MKSDREIGSPSIFELLRMAQFWAEKCELEEARKTYSQALQLAKKSGDSRSLMEALSGLLRLAGEALDEDEVKRLEHELDAQTEAHPQAVPPMVWYCKAVIARHHNDPKLAQRHILRYLTALRHDIDCNSGKRSSSCVFSDEEMLARGWLMLAIILWQRDRLKRSMALSEELLKRLEAKKLRGINGMIYLLIGGIYEKRNDYSNALKWFHKANSAFMAEHSWYFYLYVLYAYARVARSQKNYAQAYWYLELIEKAVGAPEFGFLRREIEMERVRLKEDAIDLLIDSRQCRVKTREIGEVSLGKQYVLLHILEALSGAHGAQGTDNERGLSKAEIIERVWKEKYRPEAHDNKLYYNINRLRRLIEPDVHKPKYLLNWREGYRLAPGLKVQWIGRTLDREGLSAGLKLKQVGGSAT